MQKVEIPVRSLRISRSRDQTRVLINETRRQMTAIFLMITVIQLPIVVRRPISSCSDKDFRCHYR